MSKPLLNVREPFTGIVMTHDMQRIPEGRWVYGFVGRVSVMSAKEGVGWEPTGHNSANWMVRIQGPTTSINLMGCQVRAVYEGEINALKLTNAPHDLLWLP